MDTLTPEDERKLLREIASLKRKVSIFCGLVVIGLATGVAIYAADRAQQAWGYSIWVSIIYGIVFVAVGGYFAHLLGRD
jgi:hypothetical protein